MRTTSPVPKRRHEAAVAEGGGSLADPDVLALAAAEKRRIATFDRDYGELIFARGLAAPPPVILFSRMTPGGFLRACSILARGLIRLEQAFEENVHTLRGRLQRDVDLPVRALDARRRQDRRSGARGAVQHRGEGVREFLQRAKVNRR